MIIIIIINNIVIIIIINNTYKWLNIVKCKIIKFTNKKTKDAVKDTGTTL